MHLRTIHSLLPLFHQPFRVARHTKDPGDPPLSAVYACPSPWRPLGSGAAKNRKTQRLPAKKKMHAANAQIHAANSPPGESLATRKYCAHPKLGHGPELLHPTQGGAMTNIKSCEDQKNSESTRR